MPPINTAIAPPLSRESFGTEGIDNSHNIITRAVTTNPLPSPFTTNVEYSDLLNVITDLILPKSQSSYAFESPLNQDFELTAIANRLAKDWYERHQLKGYDLFHTDPLVAHVHRSQIASIRKIPGIENISHLPVESTFESAEGNNEESTSSLPTYQPKTSVIEIIDSRFDGIVDSNMSLFHRLDRLRYSGDDFVYPGGIRPTDLAFADAQFFISKLPSLRIIPEISLVADGEINFLWNDGGIYIDLGFYGVGEGSYYARDSNDREYFCDRFPVSQGLPDQLFELIRTRP